MKKCEFDEIKDFVNTISKTLGITVNYYSIENSSMDKELTKVVAESNLKCVFMGETSNKETKVYSMTTGKYPTMLRVRPILNWKYKEIWEFFKKYKCQYCSLYEKGYTSLGTKDDTIPNPLLLIESTGEYLPAYMLIDESKERIGRVSKATTKL